jgi:hypothetical protein
MPASIEKAVRLYMKATENDWRTVQSTAQQAITRHAAHTVAQAEVEELMKVARSILAGENGQHLRISEIDEK